MDMFGLSFVEWALYGVALALAIVEALFGQHPAVVRFEKRIGDRLSRPLLYAPWVAFWRAARDTRRSASRRREREAPRKAKAESTDSYRIDYLGMALNGTFTLVTLSLIGMRLRWGVGPPVITTTLIGIAALLIVGSTTIPRRLSTFRWRARSGNLAQLPAFESLALYAPWPSPSRLIVLTLRRSILWPIEWVGAAIWVTGVIVFDLAVLGVGLIALALAIMAMLLFFLIFTPSSWMTRLSNHYLRGLRGSPLALLSFWVTMSGLAVQFAPRLVR